MIHQSRTLGAAGILIFLLGVPFALGNYGHYLLAIVIIYALVALGFNVLLGMGGRSRSDMRHSGQWAPTSRHSWSASLVCLS